MAAADVEEPGLGDFSSLFETYSAACRTGAGVHDGSDAEFEEGVERVREHLLSASGEAAACMICLESIRPQDPVWSCQQGCHAVMHLPCIQSWSRRTLVAAQEKAAGHPGQPPSAAARGPVCWGCPKCRQDYLTVPSGYSCWCGKVADPEWNPWNAAHSCGERCERPAPGCAHPCMLLCHPGPCPPCPRVVSASCHCGAVVTDKRCGRHEFSCGGMCGALLPCGHTCPSVCHAGDCPPCGLVSLVPCRCGAEAKELPCSRKGVFQCTRVCGQPLDCGRHVCEALCHAGACGGCQLAGPKACPCGKQQLPHAACDVVVPPCGETCGKLLACGAHRCHERCHTGPCTTVCRATVEKSCECGKTQRTVQCRETFRCERRCANLRSCGRHPCRRRCCDGASCPPCEEVCNKWLKCRNHRCPAPCHTGECAPCPLSARITCACGRTQYSVPCGRESGALPPKCSHACPVPALCRHAAVLPLHRCHFGPCPPCPHPCGTQLPCAHGCSSQRCHDPPPPVVPDHRPPPPPVAPTGPSSADGSASGSSGLSKQQREAMQQPPPAQAAAAEARRLISELPRTPLGQLTACPACLVPVPVTCLGQHTTVQVPCTSAAPFSCDLPCGQPLACGNHSCQAGCHSPAAQPCVPCTLPCQRPRTTCQHACPLPCHPPSQACPACVVSLHLPCHCGKTTLDFECGEVTAAALPADRLCCGKACHRLLPGCPHVCQLSCHAGGCSSEGCSAEVTVRCGCKRVKKKLGCRQVQALLLAATGSAAYDGATSLRVLPCDDACAKAAAAEAAAGKAATAPGAGAGSSISEAAGAAAARGTAAASGAATAGAEGASAEQLPRRRMSKEEKLAEREAARLSKAAAQQRKQVQQLLVLGAVVAVAVLLALGLRHLLLLADRAAQDKWSTEL